MIDQLGLHRPVRRRRRRREVRPRARAQRDRLADVQRLAARVAEDVDARLVGQPAHVGPALARAAQRAPAVGAARAHAPRPRRARGGERVLDRRGGRAQPREQRAEDARAGLCVGSARCWTSTSIPSEPASAASLRWRTSGAKRRASATVHSTGGAGHAKPERSNAWRSTRRSNDAECATSTLPSIMPRELGQHVLGAGRLVDHGLRDAGEPLDPARQRRRRGHERLPAVMQLAAADEHGADLRQLAAISAQPVGLRVDDQELGGGEGSDSDPWRTSNSPTTPRRHAAGIARFLRPPCG